MMERSSEALVRVTRRARRLVLHQHRSIPGAVEIAARQEDDVDEHFRNRARRRVASTLRGVRR